MKRKIETAAVETPLDYSGVVEGTLMSGFPAAWEGTYFFDPARRRSTHEECSVIFSRLSAHVKGSLRDLQDATNRLAHYIDRGRGVVFRIGGTTRSFCYLMGESPDLEKGPRLREFFGERAMKDWQVPHLARLFDEFVLRHETGHSINLFQVGHLRLQGGVDEERLCDSFALLSMFRTYGDAIMPFADTVRRGRVWQKNAEYDTANAIVSVMDYVRENGSASLQSLTEIGIYKLALRISNPERVSKCDVWGTGEYGFLNVTRPALSVPLPKSARLIV